jgi:hypothetical protein
MNKFNRNGIGMTIEERNNIFGFLRTSWKKEKCFLSQTPNDQTIRMIN